MCKLHNVCKTCFFHKKTYQHDIRMSDHFSQHSQGPHLVDFPRPKPGTFVDVKHSIASNRDIPKNCTQMATIIPSIIQLLHDEKNNCSNSIRNVKMFWDCISASLLCEIVASFTRSSINWRCSESLSRRRFKRWRVQLKTIEATIANQGLFYYRIPFSFLSDESLASAVGDLVALSPWLPFSSTKIK